MFQTKFPFKDNKISSTLSYCAHEIAKREDEVLQLIFTEEVKQDFPLCSHPELFGLQSSSKLVSFELTPQEDFPLCSQT